MSLWLTDWTVEIGGAWSGRRLMALVGGAYAGRLDFVVHPDGQAVSVSGLEVSPEFQERNLAAVMMDALYAAYPSAWIDHGGRSREGTLWWDRYSDPAPERNIHNRPMAEWAVYFEALRVAGQKVQNALHNRYLGVDGHRDTAYRYGESLEEEARRYAPAFREPPVQGPDPATAELYGGMRLVLPPRYHQIVHNSSRDVGERAEMLLSQIGYGNLPFGATWSTTEHAAFGELAQEQLLDPSSAQTQTHVAFHVQPLSGPEIPSHSVKATWVKYLNSPGIEVKLAGMTWRSPQRPGVTHSATFTPPVDAAIAPEYWQDAGAEYRARYDEIGELRPGHAARRDAGPHLYEGRGSEISAMADKLIEGIAARMRDRATAPAPRPAPEHQTVHQGLPARWSQQSPRLP
ncbi:hypothetical protein ACFU8W_48525 [Streptomyces sp. NPDC057565]|uniref:hypothetical protein n=1 Tax=Streptomyces sp. NPDC057565 TaxID=3346169 RepID=UPI0036C5A9FE